MNTQLLPRARARARTLATLLRPFRLALPALLATALAATSPSLRVLCLGDSHSAVEADWTRDLADAFGRETTYAFVPKNGARLADLGRSLQLGRPPYAHPLAWADSWQPDLLLLAFGTNEGMRRPAPGEEDDWDRILTALRIRYPHSRVVLLGPPRADPAAVPQLPAVRALQAAAAARAGVAYLDRAELLSPEETGMQPDHVHLTAPTYRLLAQRTAQALADADAQGW